MASLITATVYGCGGDPTSGGAAANPTAAEPTPTVNVAREVARGKRLVEMHGCPDCHTTDGRDQIGPTWKSLYGSPVALADGKVVVADEGYLRTSVREPNSQIVEG